MITALLRSESLPRRDLRLPFILLSASRPDPEEVHPLVSGQPRVRWTNQRVELIKGRIRTLGY